MVRCDYQLDLTDPDHTCRLAARIGRVLRAGDSILLSGGVGAGKTHFARCLIQSQLDQPEDIPSPTYTLVQTYPCRHAAVWHADLYRLTDLGELDELGLLDAFDDAICLIEWPDRLADQAPENALSLFLDAGAGDDTRVARISWSDPTWSDKLKEVLND